ncbi:ankyrin repeat domain-containing protein [Wolbachia pipientis]|uniref:ankyrin repeat domain-containing protein n=1 Tax=Wolbachia pipientis TaxID=955 RepID=UPI00202F5478|nr:ankyrin repeat domain-containing protein [Wolbachia pipientis]
MGIDLSALTTNADKLDKHIDKNDKQEQDKKNEQLYGAIERKVTKEKHKRERPRGRDGTIKECKKLFKEGASPEVLTELEKSLRGQKEYHRYYVQCFLPALKRKISKELDPLEKEKIEQVIFEVTRKSSNQNHYSRKDSQDSGIGSDNDDERQTDNRNVNDRLLEAAKRGNKTKIKKRVQEGADISAKDGKGNNALHYIAALPRGKQRVACLNLILSLVKKEEISKDKLSEAINPEKGQTLIQKLLFNKITKEEHSSESVSGKVGKFLKRPFTKYDDNTIEAAIKLFELGANIGDLQLSKEELQNLDREHERYYLKFLEKLAELIKKPELKQEIKTQIKKIIAYTINTPDSNDNYLLHLAINNYDKGLFQELLQKGADINLKDANGDNALHHIASLKGEQKVICLKLISSLVEKGSVPKEKLSEAINATNKEERTPLQVALIKKAEKGEHLSRKNTIFDPAINYDNTTKFCATLLQNGANPNFLDLKDEKFHTDSYYLVLRDLKDYRKTPHTTQEKARETKEQLEKKYNIKTPPRQLQSTAQSVGSSIKEAASNTGKALSAIAKYIDPASRIRELLAITITVTVIAMAAFAFFQGQVGIGAAIPIIAVAGVVCLTLTLGFSGIKKLFENSTDKVKNLVDSDQQKSSDQPEHKNPPNSRMSDTHSEPHKKSQGLTAN